MEKSLINSKDTFNQISPGLLPGLFCVYTSQLFITGLKELKLLTNIILAKTPIGLTYTDID